MGQKVSPIGMRVGVIRDWESRWYAEKDFGDLLLEDVNIRKLVDKECKKDALVSRIEIERSKKNVTLIIRTARPAAFIGSGDENNLLNTLKKKLVKLTKKDIDIKVVEVLNPDLDARLVAMKIAKMLEERQSFRTAQKKAIQSTMRAGAKGIKTAVSGRLGGADIARTEGYSEGVTPLHTLRSDIDYAWEEAMTTYGKLGVKVWICRGEVLPGEMVKEPEKPKNAATGKPARKPGVRRGAKKDAAPKAEEVKDAAPVEAPVAEAPKEEVKEGE